LGQKYTNATAAPAWVFGKAFLAVLTLLAADAVEGDAVEGTSDRTDGGSAYFFSTEREIDLYELEELCDAVGWSRRPYAQSQEGD
jgi:hypothetical protein